MKEGNTTHSGSSLPGKLRSWGPIAGLFILAVLMRLPYLDDPYYSLLPEREYRSAIIARFIYFENAENIPAWRKEIAAISRQRETTLEPPVTEWLTAQAYRLLGGERAWAPRLLTTLMWFVGGGFLYLMAKALAGRAAALFSTGFYLFTPLNIHMSVSFMPDPLMIMLFAMSLWAIMRYDRQPGWRRLIVAALFTAACLLIKPLCIFALTTSFAALAIWRRGPGGLLHPHSLTFYAIALLPTGLYYFYGIFVAGFLQQQVQMSFIPELLLTRYFWREWFLIAVNLAGMAAIVGALLGYMLIPVGPARLLLTGLAAGYLVFGFVFTHHIHTHGYYQLQLLVILALALGPALAHLFHAIRNRRPDILTWTAAMSILLLIFIQVRHDVHVRHYGLC